MESPKQSILDSHVHLWPEETANEEGHTWMPPGMPMARPHLPAHYLGASRTKETSESCGFEVQGLVFIESDVRYEPTNENVSTWAKPPLDEIVFVRRLVEDHGDEANSLVKGIIPWAPMNQSPPVLEEYLQLAEKSSGEHAWKRTKGFRFLLQALVDEQDFKALMFSQNFVTNVRILGRRGFCFDVGVDQRSAGSWQLEYAAKAMASIHQGVEEDQKTIFIINHLCKPDFSDQGLAFDEWSDAISSMSKLSRTYMKLSGAFSELPFNKISSPTPINIAGYMKPWISHTLQCFGAERIMFGSDWPICNVQGPGENDSWIAWKDVVQCILEDEDYGLSDRDKQRIWIGTTQEAYRLN